MSETKKKVAFWLKMVLIVGSAFGLGASAVGGAVIEAGESIYQELKPEPTPIEDFKGEL